jgi:hypothetical protein
MANEIAQVPVKTAQHFEEDDDVIMIQSDTQLPIPLADIQEHFEEDDSMSLTNVAIAVSDVLFSNSTGLRTSSRSGNTASESPYRCLAIPKSSAPP